MQNPVKIALYSKLYKSIGFTSYVTVNKQPMEVEHNNPTAQLLHA